jgi:hypothetical protein
MWGKVPVHSLVRLCGCALLLAAAWGLLSSSQASAAEIPVPVTTSTKPPSLQDAVLGPLTAEHTALVSKSAPAKAPRSTTSPSMATTAPSKTATSEAEGHASTTGRSSQAEPPDTRPSRPERLSKAVAGVATSLVDPAAGVVRHTAGVAAQTLVDGARSVGVPVLEETVTHTTTAVVRFTEALPLVGSAPLVVLPLPVLPADPELPADLPLAPAQAIPDTAGLPLTASRGGAHSTAPTVPKTIVAEGDPAPDSLARTNSSSCLWLASDPGSELDQALRVGAAEADSAAPMGSGDPVADDRPVPGPAPAQPDTRPGSAAGADAAVAPAAWRMSGGGLLKPASNDSPVHGERSPAPDSRPD